MVGERETAEVEEIELEEELRYFESMKTEWLKKYAEKYVLVKGSELLDVFSSLEDAYKEGVKRLGNQPFFIRQVVEVESIDETPSLVLAILNAHL